MHRIQKRKHLVVDKTTLIYAETICFRMCVHSVMKMEYVENLLERGKSNIKIFYQKIKELSE